MNILVMSDLHLHFWNKESAIKHYKQALYNQILSKKEFDCIVISGDIWEYDFVGKAINPYKFLSEIFNVNCPIICCLGNHEFAYKDVDSVLKWFNSFTDRYNIHLLDIEGHFTYNNINFVGNVFWYDNSLGTNPLSQPDRIDKSWLDSTIEEFIPSIENKKCKDQILQNINSDSNITNILVTHTVPHKELNWFSVNQPYSLYNQYSGCSDFLKELKNVSWSFSGHTHKRMSMSIYNINCVNPGNDYFDEYNNIKYYLINTQGTQEL